MSIFTLDLNKPAFKFVDFIIFSPNVLLRLFVLRQEIFDSEKKRSRKIRPDQHSASERGRCNQYNADIALDRTGHFT